MTQGNCGADERRGRTHPRHHQLNLADFLSHPSRIYKNQPVKMQRNPVILMHFKRCCHIILYVHKVSSICL